MKDERTYKIIGAAMEVHKELGCGFLEAVYQEALQREFRIQGILNKAQPIVDIKYKGEVLDKKEELPKAGDTVRRTTVIETVS